MALESLDIRVRQQGARTVARDIRNIGFAASAVSGQLSTTTRLLRGLAIASVARRIFAFADSFTNLSNRVRLFTDSQESANRTTNELIGIANRARVATDAVSLTYQRLAINQDRLGLSTERVLKLTETLSKAVAIGGSSAQEAGGALRQFSQALSGNFQAAAQELNSVLEQTPGLADALADGLGVSTDRIKVLAREGKLNSDIVIKALESQADVIESRFSRIAPTIGQAFQVLTNSTEVLVGQFFRVSDVGKTITSALISLSQRFLQLALDEDRLNEIIDRTVDLFKILLAIKVAQFLFGVARAMDLVVASSTRLVRVNLFGSLVRLPAVLAAIVTGLSGVRIGLLALIASNPFTILLAAVAAFVGLLFGVRNELVTIGGESARVQDIIVVGFEIIVEKTQAWLQRLFEASKAFRDLLPTARQFFNSVIAGFTIFGRVVSEVFQAIAKDAAEGFSIITQKVGDVMDALQRAVAGDFSGAFETLFKPVTVEAESAFSKIDFARIFREEGQRDFLQEATGFFESVFGPELADRAAKRFRDSLAKAAPDQGPGAEPAAAGGVLKTTFALTEQQKAVVSLIAQMDVGTRVALEYADAQSELDKAVTAGVINQKEQREIIKQLATNDFRRLAAETDELASLTIEYKDALAELNARATAAGLQGSQELTNAIARQRDEFEKARFELRRYQESLTAVESVQQGVEAGFRRFTEGLGTIASNVADVTEDLLNKSLDAIHEFTTTGKLDFRQFALDVIADIQKVILKMLALRVIQASAAAGSRQARVPRRAAQAAFSASSAKSLAALAAARATPAARARTRCSCRSSTPASLAAAATKRSPTRSARWVRSSRRPRRKSRRSRPGSSARSFPASASRCRTLSPQ